MDYIDEPIDNRSINQGGAKMNLKDYKITIIGDSIPKGLMIDENLRINRLATNAVSEIEKHYGINIDNKSTFGQTLKRIYERKIVDDYLENINPNDNNVLVWSIGGNDADYNWDEVGQNPTLPHSSKTDYTAFKNYLKTLTKKLLDKNIKVLFVNFFPMHNERYFKNIISRKANGENVLKFLNNDLSNLSRHQELFNNAIIENAVTYDCEIIDIRSHFLNDIHYLDYCANDGIHPNTEGQKYISEIIKDYISTK